MSRPRGFVWSPFAVLHGVEATLRKEKPDRGTRHLARTVGFGRALRAPDPALEPQDASFHPGRAKRHLPHRPAQDPLGHRGELRLRARPRRGRRRILFVGTKKQAQGPMAEYAQPAGCRTVNQRWLGGMLTNFATVAGRVESSPSSSLPRAGEFDAIRKVRRCCQLASSRSSTVTSSGIANLDHVPNASSSSTRRRSTSP